MTAVNKSGTTDIIISKVDILEIINDFNIIFNNQKMTFNTIGEMKSFIQLKLKDLCPLLNKIYFSSDKEIIENFVFC